MSEKLKNLRKYIEEVKSMSMNGNGEEDEYCEQFNEASSQISNIKDNSGLLSDYSGFILRENIEQLEFGFCSSKLPNKSIPSSTTSKKNLKKEMETVLGNFEDNAGQQEVADFEEKKIDFNKADVGQNVDLGIMNFNKEEIGPDLDFTEIRRKESLPQEIEDEKEKIQENEKSPQKIENQIPEPEIVRNEDTPLKKPQLVRVETPVNVEEFNLPEVNNLKKEIIPSIPKPKIPMRKRPAPRRPKPKALRKPFSNPIKLPLPMPTEEIKKVEEEPVMKEEKINQILKKGRRKSIDNILDEIRIYKSPDDESESNQTQKDEEFEIISSPKDIISLAENKLFEIQDFRLTFILECLIKVINTDSEWKDHDTESEFFQNFISPYGEYLLLFSGNKKYLKTEKGIFIFNYFGSETPTSDLDYGLYLMTSLPNEISFTEELQKFEIVNSIIIDAAKMFLNHIGRTDTNLQRLTDLNGYPDMFVMYNKFFRGSDLDNFKDNLKFLFQNYFSSIMLRLCFTGHLHYFLNIRFEIFFV